MNNSEKILKTISSLIENGILTTKDIKKELDYLRQGGDMFESDFDLDDD